MIHGRDEPNDLYIILIETIICHWNGITKTKIDLNILYNILIDHNNTMRYIIFQLELD